MKITEMESKSTELKGSKLNNYTCSSNTNMMASINRESYQISYRCGDINDSIISSPEPLGPFSHFGLVYVYSTFRFCHSTLFG